MFSTTWKNQKEIEMLQQRASSASRKIYYLVPFRFNSTNSFSQRTVKTLTPPPTWRPGEKSQLLFTDREPCRQRAGLNIYYMKAEWQNLLTQVPVGQLLGVIEAIIINNKKIAALRVCVSLSDGIEEFPFHYYIN